MVRLNEFCTICSHKMLDKNIDEPCKRCAGTHIHSNYLFHESQGCNFCIEKQPIKEHKFKLTVDFRNKLEVEKSIEMRDGLQYEWSYFDIEYCPKCGRKLE